MKKALVLLMFSFSFFAKGQTDTSKPYLRYPVVPAFELLQVDGNSVFSDSMLKKNKPLLLMYFSPTCDHCQHQTEELLRKIDSFKNIQIVMATFEPLEALKDFYNRYKLAGYPNIFIGRDTKFTLPPFYRIPSPLPFLALYNKDGNLITTFIGNRPANAILKAFY